MSVAVEEPSTTPPRMVPSWFSMVRRRRAGKPKVLVGGGIVGLVVVMALLAPVIAPYNPIAQYLGATLQGPSLAHLMGTDEFGRDVLSRVLYGARLDLQIAFLGTMFCFILGTLLGLVGGFFGGIVDLVVGRLVDLVIAFPAIVVIIALIAVLGLNLINLYIGITVTGWTAYTRLVRGEVLVAARLPYVQAARCLGYSDSRIVFRHILPNVITRSFIFLVTDMVGTILLVTALSYLGLGPQPPTAEWGAMISEAQPFMLQAWWIALFPGLAIVLTGVGLAVLGDGLADLLRPQAE